MSPNPWTMSSFRDDLRKFIRCLKFYEVQMDYYTLEILLAQIHKSETWDIKLSDLVFRIDKSISGTLPHDIERVEVYFSHTCALDESMHKSGVQDHITKYGFDLNIRAYSSSSMHQFAWHLDQNIPSTTSKVSHPAYHFQAGGKALEGLIPGDLVVLTAPRIAHPPMDLFLGVHFILNNFFSTKDYARVSDLFNDVDYIDVLINSKTRMWDSYFTAFLPGKPQHQFYTKKNVFPLHVD
jgi:hypothetical protein